MNNPFPNGIRFNETYSAQCGRMLSNRLNLKGKGSEKLANGLSSFFLNLQKLIIVQKMKGWEDLALKDRTNCIMSVMAIYHFTIDSSEHYDSLPLWIRNDVVTAVEYIRECHKQLK